MSSSCVSLSSFKVNSYRCLDSLELPSLSQVNLVTGVNGIGKTSILEALWLFAGRYNPSIFWDARVQRSDVLPVNPVAPLTRNGYVGFVGVENEKEYVHTVEFTEFSNSEIDRSHARHAHFNEDSISQPVAGHLNATVNGEELPRLNFRRTSRGLVSIAFKAVLRSPCVLEGTPWSITANEQNLRRFSHLVEAGNKADLLEALSLIQPEISDIEILTRDQGPYLSFVTNEGHRLALQALGGGFSKLLHVYLATISSRNSIILIDELEESIHHGVLTDLWRLIRKWTCGWRVQVFATTQSVECLHAAIDAFRGDEHKLTVLNLHWRDGAIKTATFSGETLQGALELGIELR